MDLQEISRDLHDAHDCARDILCAQVFGALVAVAKTREWELHLPELAGVLRGGCEIRCDRMEKWGFFGRSDGQTVGNAGEELGIAEFAAGASVLRGSREETEGVETRAVARRGGGRGDAGESGGGGVSGQLSQREIAGKRGAEHARCAGG